MNAPTKTVTVALLGDSMLETLGEECSILHEALGASFPDIKWVLRNHAVGGTRANYGLYRITRDYEHWGKKTKCLAYDDPDLVLLESFAYNHTLDREEGVQPYRAIMTRIVEQIRTHTKARICFVRTIPPDHAHFIESVPNYYEFPLANRQIMARTVDLYMAEAKRWADEQGLPCADAYAACLSQIEQGVPHRWFVDPSDDIHPSGYGHRFVATCIAHTLQREQLV